jgi:hypothetical protein
LACFESGRCVTRSVVANGEYIIETVGIGTGFLGGINTWPPLTESVWDDIAWGNAVAGRSVENRIDEFQNWLREFEVNRCFAATTEVLKGNGSAEMISNI